MREWSADIRTIAILENEELYNDFQSGCKYKVKPSEAPEDGGGFDIGFGHKIQSDEVYHKGISIEECWRLLERDYMTCHFAVRDYLGHGLYAKLPPTALFLLTDFMFNGCFHKFPKFVRHITNQDWEKALEECKRYWTHQGKKRELKMRNEMTQALLLQLIAEDSEEGFLVTEEIS